MATTPNKGYELMATGTQTDNWGNTLNADVFGIVDNNLGGIVTKSLTNVNVSLTPEESECVMLRLIGTLTGNVQITTQCIGFFFLENETSGSFSVTVRNNQISTSTTVPQGGKVIVLSDATNGCRVGATSDFPSGTRMPFQQTTVPTGWTKDLSATVNNAAIRLTTGSVSTGGTENFTDVLKAQTISQANLPNYTLPNTLTISGNQPGLVYDLANSGSGSPFGSPSSNRDKTWKTTNLSLTGAITSGGLGTPMNFAVKYVDFVIGVKN